MLHRDRYPGRAVYDTAISHAMLRSVANGARGESLRLYTPDKALLFSSLDSRRPGYAKAVEIARDAGFEPVIRLAGGHAAVFLEESVAFAWASADEDAPLRIKQRFEHMSRWIVTALASLGLDARVGEVPGEYCPGEYSVNIAGRSKVMGVGQRVIRGGAHVGGVITVGETTTLRNILVPIYEALELEIDPNVAGGLVDFESGLTTDDVIDAFARAVEGSGYAFHSGKFDSSVEEAAQALTPLHVAKRKSGGTAGPRPNLVSSTEKTFVQTELAMPREEDES